MIPTRRPTSVLLAALMFCLDGTAKSGNRQPRLDEAGGESYPMSQSLLNHLRRRRIERYVVTVVTQVIVG